jgi:hypothetical protein
VCIHISRAIAMPLQLGRQGGSLTDSRMSKAISGSGKQRRTLAVYFIENAWFSHEDFIEMYFFFYSKKKSGVLPPGLGLGGPLA